MLTNKELKEILLKKSAYGAPILEHELKGLLREMGLKAPECVYLKKGEAMAAPISLNYPLVAKVSSKAIASKSDAGGIVLGIRDEASLKDSVRRLFGIEGAEGVLVEEMAPPQGVEIIIGGLTDLQFGPVVMFGMGGLLVELYKDVAFALAPLGRDGALRLIGQVRGRRVIEGYRGRGPLDKGAVTDVIVAVSRIMETGAVEEVDLNPVALYPEGALVLDAKIKLR